MTQKSVSVPCLSMKQEVCLSDNDTRDRSMCNMDLSLYCTLLVACVAHGTCSLKALWLRPRTRTPKKVKVACDFLYLLLFIFSGSAAQRELWPSRFTRFLDHTQRRPTVGKTPLDEWSARHRDLYPDNTQHTRQTNINAPGGFETTIAAGERP
jgi:hypothetical protein